MSSMTETICIKRWQAYLMLAMSGLAIGMMVGATARAVGL